MPDKSKEQEAANLKAEFLKEAEAKGYNKEHLDDHVQFMIF
jgi:hypothetical protein|tara:strand:+ start:1268 stop:1390 length:123 start_codon:yes stop_codon:yes gene_type:complete